MKRTYRHTTIPATISLLLLTLLAMYSCADSADGMDASVNKGHVPLAVNMTRSTRAAEGGTFSLMFWTGSIASSGNPLATLNTSEPWFNSLNGQEVNYYPFDGANDYPVTNNGVQAMYPFDNSPVHAVGFYPSDSLTLSGDKRTLTPDKDKFVDALPGLIDVCTTQIESGTEKAPFTSSKDNELQFAHTQVKLNFNYQRTENVDGRIAEIWVTIPDEQLADTWTLAENGFTAKNDVADTKPLYLASTSDYYSETPQLNTMYYADVKDNHISTIKDGKKNCYVLHDQGMFTNDGSQSYITFRLNAIVISNTSGVRDRIYDNQVIVPLQDEAGNPWTETVKAGDAFTITITFDSKKLYLLAEKTKWEPGGYVNIPINPSL